MKMTSKTYHFKNTMCVHAPKLICSKGDLKFQTYKLVFGMYNKLRLHAAILSSMQPSEVQSVSSEREQRWTVHPKLALKENSLWIKFEA